MNGLNKKTLIVAFVLVIAAGAFWGIRYFTQDQGLAEIQEPKTGNGEKEGEGQAVDSFVQCLSEAGVMVYGSSTCPACASLVSSFGGYEVIDPIYVECTEERDKCGQEMQTNYVPEIQISGQVYSGQRDLGSLAEATGCEI